MAATRARTSESERALCLQRADTPWRVFPRHIGRWVCVAHRGAPPVRLRLPRRFRADPRACTGAGLLGMPLQLLCPSRHGRATTPGRVHGVGCAQHVTGPHRGVGFGGVRLVRRASTGGICVVRLDRPSQVSVHAYVMLWRGLARWADLPSAQARRVLLSPAGVSGTVRSAPSPHPPSTHPPPL